MNEQKFIGVQVQGYPDPLSQALLDLNNVLQDMLNRLTTLESQVEYLQQKDSDYD